MKKQLFYLVAGTFLAFSSCTKLDTENVVQDELSLKKGTMVQNFTAHLSGDQEVPVRETLATGEAIFQLSKDGTELSYKLIVANLENITQAHIHLPAAPGSNAPFVVWLYPSAPPLSLIPGVTNGILAQGVITTENLLGILGGRELSVLIDYIKNGEAYVNVHTSLYPGGEIRGQVK